MINVQIYCAKKHQDYEKTYNIIKEVLKDCGEPYNIERIYKTEDIYRRRILYQPHIVINRQVVYTRGCPKKEEMVQILKTMGLIK